VELSGQFYDPPVLFLGKEVAVPFGHEAGWDENRSELGVDEKKSPFSALDGNRSPVVQLVA
jgi:hypothetical protein